MARRSKEDALATRNSLLDAAERVFQLQGVAGTSLNDIAEAAGTTRGAIYWHFKDKADLFNAMMDRISLPLQQVVEDVVAAPEPDPLPALRAAIQCAFGKAVHDPRTRRVFEVATHKVEYVDSLCAVRERHRELRERWVERLRFVLLKSATSRGVKLPVAPAVAAQGLQALTDGLIQNWLLDTKAFDLEAVGRQAIDTYLQGLGLGTAQAMPPCEAKA